MEPSQNKYSAPEVGEADFETEVLKSHLPVLVAFFSSWSRPCKVAAPVLEELKACCAGKAKVVWVNADDNPELSLWYEVQAIPTLLYFIGGTLRAKVVGTASKEAVLAKLEQVEASQQ